MSRRQPQGGMERDEIQPSCNGTLPHRRCPDRRRPGDGVQPPRGPGDHQDAEGGRHRLLHVQQLRGGPVGVRHPDRQLPAAAGRLRRAQLLRPRPGRGLPRSTSTTPATAPRTSPSSSVSATCSRQPAAGRRQERLDPADQNGRADQRPTTTRAQPAENYTVRVIRGAVDGSTGRGSGQSVTNAVHGATRSTSRSTTSARRPFSDYVTYAKQATSTTSASRAAAAPAGCSSASARIPSSVNLGEIFDLVNINIPHRAQPATAAGRRPRRQERHRRSSWKCRPPA